MIHTPFILQNWFREKLQVMCGTYNDSVANQIASQA